VPANALPLYNYRRSPIKYKDRLSRTPSRHPQAILGTSLGNPFYHRQQ
jgi:hypothetical protein